MGARYGRVVGVDRDSHWLEIEFAPRTLRLDSPSLPAPKRRQLANRLLGLDIDLAPFQQMARRDAILAPLVRQRPGLRRPALLNPFEAVVRAVAGQLISVAAATTLVARLTARFGERLPAGHVAFPTPERLTGAESAIQSLGYPRSKARTIALAAKAVLDGTLDWPVLGGDPDLADRRLRGIPGVGPWTSAYVRWRALGDLDAFPASDLGIIKAMAREGVRSHAVAGRAERWRPWRGLAIAHLWASLA